MRLYTQIRQATLRDLIRWAGTLITLVLFIRLLTDVDWKVAWKNLSEVPVWILLLALALYFAGMVFNGIRWYIILQAVEIRLPLPDAVRIIFVGAFSSNFLPSTVGGDAVRFLSLMHFTTRRAAGLASIILDRLLNVAAFLTVLPLSFLTFGSSLPLFNAASLFLIIPAASTTEDRWWKNNLLTSRIKKWISEGRDAIEIWSKSPGSIFLAFIISWLSIFVIFLAIWLIARGLDIDVTLIQVMGATAITYFITLIPISINGFGVREFAVTTIYMYLGATLEQASTLAIVTRVLMMIVTLPGALWLPKYLTKPNEMDDITPP